ncbi:putative cytoplasmic protein [Streptococcus varani]|uniref:Putative cytoplasmic protein n=1 Tax=Streptococcus varani TaxID=1608583 RepID=A0A0E4H5H3_9STRE|nr:DUF1803 domain-containing protein [Streptococcus varani]CQR25320.1 putative cytoplasmic protein [Streptococcus varani]
MIRIFNANKLTRQPFFQDVINYLHDHEDVTLRQIKVAFEGEKNIDRQLENAIEAGYIIRENRRYRNAFSLLESLDGLSLDTEVFVDTEAAVFSRLKELTFRKELTNSTNELIIVEEVDFVREGLTLDSYFYKMRSQEVLSRDQEKLYAILGDINPDYALKYMTNFLLKFTRKEVVIQRRPDIFVEALLLLGFMNQVAPQTYALTMTMKKEDLIFSKKNKGPILGLAFVFIS